MKSFVFSFLLFFPILSFADVTTEFPTQDFLSKNIKIIDIRTPSQWKKTGIIPGSYTITYYNKNGIAHPRNFGRKLSKILKSPYEPFAIIGTYGVKTKKIAKYLGNEIGFNVINLNGGIKYATGIFGNIKLVPYVEK